MDYIIKKAQNIVTKCGTRNPFRIAKELGIHVMFRNNFSQLKGMYKVILRNRFILINANLPEPMQRIVCAHELGHDQLHRQFAADTGLCEFVLYDMDTRPEYEANLFASELLLPGDEVLSYIKSGYDTEQIARLMHTDINLVSLRVAYFIQQGYAFRPGESRSDFLK